MENRRLSGKRGRGKRRYMLVEVIMLPVSFGMYLHTASDKSRTKK